MSLATNITDLATRVATEIKAVRTLVNGNQAGLSALTTTNKGNLVSAINELQAAVQAASQSGGAAINDTSPSTASVYSSTKTQAQIDAAVAALVTGAPGLLDTLDELANALGDDPNFATTTATALGNRVRVDAAQALTGTQQTQARTNIGAGVSNLAIGTTAGTAADAAAVTTSLAGKANTSHSHVGADVAQATDTLRGTVELATTAEATTGTDTVRAVTPAGLKAVADTKANTADVGSTTTNFVTTFEAGLV